MTQCGRFSDQTDLVATAVIPEPVDNRPYGDRAHVLAQTDAQSALQRVPTAVCCPKCGEAVTLYERGLPETVPYFETTCQQCDVDLRAWCAVAVDTDYLQVVKPSTLTAMVQQFWDTWLWSGITNSKGEPRNDEYRDRLTTKAATFGWGWEVSCPLCRRPLRKLGRVSAIVNGNLDYHHWSHEPDRGICLCRECHDIIGFDTYDTKLEERAASWGFDSRHDLQIVRLALRDAAVTNRSAGPQYASELVDRYNLPQSAARIQELLRAINAEEQLRERFVDERLVDGIEN